MKNPSTLGAGVRLQGLVKAGDHPQGARVDARFRGHDGLVLPAVTPAKAGVQAPGRVSTDLDVALGPAD